MILRGCFLANFLLCAVLSAQSLGNFDALVKNADAARDAGDTDKAVALYQQALHLKPDWRQGWWVLGSILYDANRYEECQEAFLPLTVLDPDKSPAWTMVGLCEFETKNYKAALPHLENALSLGVPKSLYDVTQYHVDLILIRGGQFDIAVEQLSRAAAQGTENPRLAEAMGIAALKRPILPADVPPADHDLVMALGKAMWDAAASHGKEATAEFEALIAQYPTTPELHYLYGLVLLESDPDKAIAAFQQELVRSPSHQQTLISIASEYLKRGDYAAALPYAEKAVKSAPAYFPAHAVLGKVLVESGLDRARGIQELEKAVMMAPGNPQSRLALAAAYAKAGRKNDAATQRAEFLRLRNQLDAAAAVKK